MENNFEYYFIAGTGMADVPLLRNNDEINPRILRFLSRQEAVEIGEPVYLCYNSPIPKEPRMVDYHSVFGCRPAFENTVIPKAYF